MTETVRKIETDPAAVARLAKLEAERGPEWAAVALAEQRTAHQLAAQESEHRGFAYWWRPGGMYLNLYLWLQNTMLTPVLFRRAKMQVPMIRGSISSSRSPHFTAVCTWVDTA